MNALDKKIRFINFIENTLQYSSNVLHERFKKNNKKMPIVLKIRLKELNFNRYIILNKTEVEIVTKFTGKIDCFVTIDRARILHEILSGKLLITNISLIGKFSVNSFNKKYHSLSLHLINISRKYYSNLIKGTRFTLTQE